MASLMKRARARDRSLRERYGKAYRRLRKNSPRAVFRLDDVYRNGTWWSCYSARPKRRVFTASDGREIRMRASCEDWRVVSDRLEKSQRAFLSLLRYFGRAL